MHKGLHKIHSIKSDTFSMYRVWPENIPSSQYNIIIQNAKICLNAEYASLFLDNNGKIDCVCTTYPKLSVIKPEKDKIVTQAFTTETPFTTNISKVNKKIKNVETVISVPLLYADKTVGVLILLTKEKREFDKRDVDYLKLFGVLSGFVLVSGKKLAKKEYQLEKRDLFISLAAHELKNPLTVIKAFAQIIANKSTKQELIKTELPNKIIQEAGRITYLINELMQVGQIRKNSLQYEFRKSSLRSLIKSSIEDVKVSHPDFPIYFNDKLNEDGYIEGDYEKLMQVIINILNNAIKFSPYGSPITVKLNKRHAFYTISIKDKGIGIEKEEQIKIFEEFHKGGTKKKAGLGLGLFIAKTIVEKHQGFIKVKSELGKGTTMEVFLPAHT